MKVKFKRLTETAIVPTKATGGSAAYDLYTAEDVIIPPGRHAIPTGIAIELPVGWLADVRPRSGYSLKGFAGANGMRFNCDVLLGTIDSDYRGAVNVIVHNNDMAFRINAGQRIAQLLIHKCDDVDFEEAEELTPSIRDFNGFGSSGI